MFCRYKLLLLSAVVALISHAASSQTQVDTVVGAKLSGKFSSPIALAHKLCDDLPDNRTKVNAIYNWVTHHIKYDVDALEKGSLKEEEAKDVLNKRKGVCEGYANLVAALCKEMEIPVVVVDGYAKDWTFDNGDKLYVPRHVWNAVYVDGHWELLDATWGAGHLAQAPGPIRKALNSISKSTVQYSKKLRFQYAYKPEYFMQDPETFRIKHLPSDPVWQLSDTVMPIQVFEAGDRAVMEFNEKYSKPQTDDAQLMVLSQLDHKATILASSDRAYKYNNRYKVALASRHLAEAYDAFSKTLEETGNGRKAMTAVRTELKHSEEFLKEQKKDLLTECTELKQKNKAKHQEAKEYVRSIRTDNKSLTAKCSARNRSATRRKTNFAGKIQDAKADTRKVNPNGLEKVKPGSKPDAPNSPRLLVLEDSLSKRMDREENLVATISAHQSHLERLKKSNDQLLDSLSAYLYLSDSFLVEETKGRLDMHDSYDDEVKAWNQQFKAMKFTSADTFQKHYLALFDSTIATSEIIKKAGRERMMLCRKDMKDLERHKRWSGGGNDIETQYRDALKRYAEAYGAQTQFLLTQIDYLEQQKKLFGKMEKLYERQNKLADYMEKSEHHRHKLEEDDLAHKEALGKKENEYQHSQLKKTTIRAEKTLAKIEAAQKKGRRGRS